MRLMTARKQWPFKAPLLPDELLTSFLVRTAHHHGMAPFRFFSFYWPRHALWNRDWDRCASDIWLEDFSERSGVALSALHAASLRPWMRACGQADAQGGQIPFVLAWGIFAYRRLRYGLVFCPLCFTDRSPYYRLQWRFATTLWCDRHQVRLHDACAYCDAPIIPHRQRVQRLAQCHRCQSPLQHHEPGLIVYDPVFKTLHERMQQDTAAASARPSSFGTNAYTCLLRSLLSYFSLHQYHAKARALFELPTLPKQRRRLLGSFEAMRLSDRYNLLHTAAHFLSQCPASFLDICTQLDITQATLSRWSLSADLQEMALLLPKGQTRARHERYYINTPTLLRTRRCNKPTYRQRRAVRVGQLLKRSFDAE